MPFPENTFEITVEDTGEVEKNFGVFETPVCNAEKSAVRELMDPVSSWNFNVAGSERKNLN